MKALIVVLVVVVLLVLLGLAIALKIVKQYERGVQFRLGRLKGTRNPGLRLIIPFADVLHRVSLRIVTMPIQSQGIITRDNVSVDVSAVAYFRIVDAVKSVIAIENVRAAIDQIAQTTLRKVVGQHTLDQTLSETDQINLDIRKILDVTTVEWGVEVTLVELKDIQLPDTMKRAMAKQAEAEREKRAKIINAEGESLAAAALGEASAPAYGQLMGGRDDASPPHGRRRDDDIGRVRRPADPVQGNRPAARRAPDQRPARAGAGLAGGRRGLRGRPARGAG